MNKLVTILAGLMAKNWCSVLRRMLGVVVGYPLVGAWERLRAERARSRPAVHGERRLRTGDC